MACNFQRYGSLRAGSIYLFRCSQRYHRFRIVGLVNINGLYKCFLRIEVQGRKGGQVINTQWQDFRNFEIARCLRQAGLVAVTGNKFSACII